MAQDEEEDEILWSRFSGEEDVELWFLMIFVIFVSLVDRKRFCGPLTLVERFTQSTLQISLLHALNYPRNFYLPCHIN